MLNHNFIYQKWSLYPYALNWHICNENKQGKIANLGAFSHLVGFTVLVYVFFILATNMTHFLWIGLAWTEPAKARWVSGRVNMYYLTCVYLCIQKLLRSQFHDIIDLPLFNFTAFSFLQSVLSPNSGENPLKLPLVWAW